MGTGRRSCSSWARHSTTTALALYEAGPSAPAQLTPDTLRRLLRISIRHLDDSLRAAHRPDGLYDAYNLVAFSEAGRGGEREPAGTDARRPGRSDQLGPARRRGGRRPRRNDVRLRAVPRRRRQLRAVSSSPQAALPRTQPGADRRGRVQPVAVRTASQPVNDDIIVRDVSGNHHFNADFTNAADLATASHHSPGPNSSRWSSSTETRALELFEQIFNHHEFTGRSSTMYAYEGIGSVYWHMVAKLLLAVQESILDAPPGTDDDVLRELTRLYDRVRHGLGFNKTAAEYGAFPTDPYSHTPAHAGSAATGHDGAGQGGAARPVGRTRTHRLPRFDSLLTGTPQHPRVPNRARHAEPTSTPRSPGRSPGPIWRRGASRSAACPSSCTPWRPGRDRDHQQRRDSERGRRIDPRPGDLQRDLRSHRAHRTARCVRPAPIDSALTPLTPPIS